VNTSLVEINKLGLRAEMTCHEIQISSLDIILMTPDPSKLFCVINLQGGKSEMILDGERELPSNILCEALFGRVAVLPSCLDTALYHTNHWSC
jgi:hypothetical protein